MDYLAHVSSGVWAFATDLSSVRTWAYWSFILVAACFLNWGKKV